MEALNLAIVLCALTAGTIAITSAQQLSVKAVNDVMFKSLADHNAKRARHQETPALKWSSALAKSSLIYALKLANGSPLRHDPTNNYGENIYSGWSSFKANTISDAVQKWYDEGKGYKYDSFVVDHSKGHFTQLVWKSTTEVGCAGAIAVYGHSYKTYYVCRYNPIGNVDWQYNNNVRPLKAKSPVPSSCTDRNLSCLSYLAFCNKSMFQPMLKKECRKSCKFC